MLGHFSVFLYFAEDICLAPGHNTVPSRPQVKHSTIESLHSCQEMAFKEFQNGYNSSHLGYRNGTILANMNLHVALMSPTHQVLAQSDIWLGDGV